MKFIRTTWLVLIVLVLALGLVLAACGDQTPHVTSATLGTVVDSSQIKDPKTTFAPTDHMIHLLVSVDNALQNTTVGAKWYDVNNSNRLLFQSDATLDPFNTTADFALTSANDWTVGKYQVSVYLNSKQERTIDFVVK